MSGTVASPFSASVRSALARQSRIHAWQLRSVHRRGFQSYLVKTQLESERRTEDETYELVVFVTNGELLGRSGVTLGPGDVANLPKKIDEAVYMAGLGGDAPWQLPATGEWPRVEAFDPALAGDQALATSRALVEAWRTTVSEHTEARPSSMELFCGEDSVTLENSAGLVAHSSATRVSLLSLLLADGEHASERVSWDERRRVADLDVKAIVGRVAEEAHDLTHAIVPPSGQYAVVIDADEIVALLSPIEANASAQGLYDKSSRFEMGKPLPIEGSGANP